MYDTNEYILNNYYYYYYLSLLPYNSKLSYLQESEKFSLKSTRKLFIFKH